MNFKEFWYELLGLVPQLLWMLKNLSSDSMTTPVVLDIKGTDFWSINNMSYYS